MGDRVPAFVWITLMISVGFQCFFFGLMLQLIKEMKYKLDRVGRQVGMPSKHDPTPRVNILSKH
jgi:hypothetical protein